MYRSRTQQAQHPPSATTAPSIATAFAMLAFCLLLLAPRLAIPGGSSADGPAVPVLAIGSVAPDFCLQGIDDHKHCLKDYAVSQVLVLVFTCNHCPTAQLYESRVQQLAADYKNRNVALVAIEANKPEAVRLDELGYTDVGDSFEDMKTRAKFRAFDYPYLYDGETQSVSKAYGPTATPHLFIFDAERKLRYEGRLDNNPRENYVTRKDAREAIDSLLAGKPVEVAKTPSVGCSTKWWFKEADGKKELAKIEAQPVDVHPASADDLKALRKNSTGKLLLVDFWATWCGPCIEEFPDLETMYRMYGHRAFDLVTVSINYPDEKAGVFSALTKQHATTKNLMLGSTDIYSLIASFDPQWNAAVPYNVLIKPGGEIVYQHQGALDALELRRAIIANIVDDNYIGHQAYWKSALSK
jgi:thiol-disulfide isomerase/thioredoxin